MMNVELSIIIPWKGGNSVRETSLRNLLNCLKVQELPQNKEPIVYELIIVEFDGNEFNHGIVNHIVPEELAGYKYIPLRSGLLFNKSWCMNVGAREAKYDWLVFMDADSLFGKDYLRCIKHYIRSIHPGIHPYRNKIMFCWDYLICLPGKDNPISRHVRPDMTAAMGGIWCAEKQFYFEIFGGMNENFFGYGGEDNDAYERALALLKVESLNMMPYPLAHQYHDWEKSSVNAVPYFELARKYPLEITSRIKAVGVGKKEAPSLIEVDSLK